jgi:hypothetical protein
MKACQESKEPASVEIESESEHQEVPKEEAAVETFGALKEEYGGQGSSCRAPQKAEGTDPG